MYSKVSQNLANFSEFYEEARESFGRLTILRPFLCTVTTFDLHFNHQNRFTLLSRRLGKDCLLWNKRVTIE